MCKVTKHSLRCQFRCVYHKATITLPNNSPLTRKFETPDLYLIFRPSFPIRTILLDLPLNLALSSVLFLTGISSTSTTEECLHTQKKT
jgi:hypothetical protein